MSVMQISFKVKTIAYRNPNTRFTIIRGLIQKHDYNGGLNSEMTIKGYFPVIFKGDEFNGIANYALDENFGYYLGLIDTPSLILPQNKKSLAQFLSKRVNKLSIKKATEIVDTLGLDAISEIIKDYKVLLAIKGMKETKAKKIHSEMLNHKVFEELAIFIQGIGIESSITNKIYDKYEENSLSRIKSNPYCICYDNEIAFKYADKIAISMKISKNNKHRINTAVLQYLNNRVVSFGDICVHKNSLISNLNNFLNMYGEYKENKLTDEEIENAINFLSSNNLIKIEKDKSNNICLYQNIYNYIENKIIKNLTDILTEFKGAFCLKEDIDKFIDEYEAKHYKLDIKQKEAIYNSMLNGISILTGGPGTGKTHTTNTMVQAIKTIKPSASILLLAPTGKASDRLSEMTNMPSSTIHRGIKVNPYNSNLELEEIIEDFVFIDESSMIDANMFEKLTSTISSHTRVVFVGDVDQLPSVGAGLILRDMIDSKRIPTTRLTKIFRQAEKSKIVANAHKIIDGKKTIDKDGIDIKNSIGSNFIFWRETNPLKIREKLLLSIDKLINTYHYKIKDICILVPMRNGELGVNDLNRVLQGKLNPKSKSKSEYEIDELNVFRVGDKVMQNINNYDLKVFNGFIGNIVDIYTGVAKGGALEYKIKVQYSQKEVEYSEKEFEQLELAFAMTIHKSQGSEFPVVILPIHKTQKTLLNRNIIYTGVTRAKDKLIMIGEEESLNYAVDQVAIFDRVSRLKEKIIDIAV